MKYFLFLMVFSFGFLHALPGEIMGYSQFSTPIISLESLDLHTCKILRQWNLIEHVPEINWREHPEYFLHRNRTVYLTEDEKFAFKIWEEIYPASHAFLRAFQKNFYQGIAKVEALIFDKLGNCRGYVTSYMISRTFHRMEWDAYEFQLETNAFGVNIFSCHERQPQNYITLFNKLVDNTLKTGIFSADFCPNNTVIDPLTGTMYLIDLEDVLDLQNISIEDSETQMLLEYDPKDFRELLLSR